MFDEQAMGYKVSIWYLMIPTFLAVIATAYLPQSPTLKGMGATDSGAALLTYCVLHTLFSSVGGTVLMWRYLSILLRGY